MKLTIPTPCSEDFFQMPATKKGGFCNSCKKEVIDFTLLSDSQILEVFQKNNSLICGRFKSTQLEKDYRYFEKPGLKQNSWIAAVFSTLLLLSASDSKGKTAAHDLKSIQLDHSAKKQWDETMLRNTDSVKLVKGTVLDEMGLGLPGANIQLKGTNIKAVSAMDGKFQILLPDSTKSSEAELQINFVGYVSLFKKLNEYKEGEQLLLSLQPAVTGEITAVLAGGVVCKKPTLWQRFTRLFR